MAEARHSAVAVRPGIWMLIILAVGALRPALWLVLEWRHCPGGICGVSGTPPEWDFALFWVAGRLAWMRDFADIFVFSNFHGYIGNRFHYDPGLSPFAYPPPALLLFLPLGLLPLPLAYALWVGTGTVALLAALRVAGLRWPVCFCVLASPAFLYNLLLGQNGAFTAALLIAALSRAGRHPARAGGFGALLFIKPQIALLLPAAWAGGRNWGALAAAVLAGGVLVAVSVIAFGLAPWRLYFQQTLPEMTQVMNAPFPQGFQASAVTVFVAARAAGAAMGMARLVQLAAIVLAALAAFQLWRDDRAEKSPLTIFLVLLAMPYGYVYDMVGYAAALALVLRNRPVSLVWAFFWIWPAFARDVTAYLGLPLTPLIVLAAFIWVSRLPAAAPAARPA